ncbi:XrtA/PEP-CTERM system-associated ATPase [Arenibaculum pallidiluteum]|uniref:XrtA/PEP-CTERM system-associated ATPase n=1 Tax=Arenibaculum pallidiluteum TaxID=2812559 RepID=UPI001A967582|nr:XrtA/PEP-CTERM system-associated ATPase [Arenibaculum pallidiluteum]
MYESFYKFSGQPFRLSPDHRFFFNSQAHRKALAYLRYGLSQGEGFIVVTGPVGTGKSTLVAQLFAEIRQAPVVAAQIATTQIEADDAVRLVLAAFGVTPPTADKAAMLKAFETFLIQQHRAGKRVLLVIDEAQNLPRRTLEEFRMLSNFNLGGQPLFQSFLLGQPQFNAILADPDLEQLRQRVIASHQLEPMTAAETRAYVEHRLRLVGWTGRPSLAEDLFPLVHEETGGVPRRINTVFSRLLLMGALEEREHLDAACARTVLAELRSELAESLDRAPRRTAAEAPAPATGAADPALADPALQERLARLEARVEAQERSLQEAAEALLGLIAAGLPAGTPALHAAE